MKPERAPLCARLPDRFDQDLLQYVPALRRYALALTGNRPDAEDLVQEALRRAIDYGADGRVQDWNAYLFRVLHNVRNDEFARRTRQPDMLPLDAALKVGCAPTQDTILAVHDLQRAIRRLPPTQQQVVLLTGVLGYSYREVATLLGLPVGTVMSRLHRGRAQLGAELGTPSRGRSPTRA